MIKAGAGVYGYSVSSVDASPALVVQYVPDKGTGGDAATVDCNTASDLTFKVDGSAPSGDDAIGTAGVIDITDGNYDTLGKLVAKINSAKAWRAYIAGGLYDWAIDGSELLDTSGAQSCIGANGYTIKWDASTTDYVAFPISCERFLNNKPSGWIKDKDEAGAVNRLLRARLQFGLTGTGDIYIYQADQTGDKDATVYHIGAVADDGSTTLNTSGPITEAFHQAPIGCRLVVRVQADTSVDDIAQCSIVGQSFKSDGAYAADSKNF
jgi:hypothetical protein